MGLGSKTLSETKNWLATILGLLFAAGILLLLGFGGLYLFRHGLGW